MNFYDCGSPPEKYNDYKNRTMLKLLNRQKELLQGVRQTSLKESDKTKLKNQFILMLQNSQKAT